MGISRTETVAKNAYVATICQIINLIINFVSRTIFIRALGIEYLGVNGLFTNVLTILSFAELGIGNAIIFSMYKPLAIGDHQKVNSLMSLFKKAYNTIGFAVGGIGLLFIPFLGFIVAEQPDIAYDLRLIYVLFLLNTALSYFFIYKKSIIIADQKNYIASIYSQVIQFIRAVVQIAVIMIFHSFLWFLIIQIVFTFLENFMISKKADKLYPYLINEEAPKLSKEEQKNIFSNVKALTIYKFGSVILNGTDNIVISALIGVAEVGLVSNYMLILSAINNLLGQATAAFTSSVGNLNAVETAERKENVFNKMVFIIFWLYGYVAMGLFFFLNPFINIWLGEEFLLSTIVVFAIVLHFYINGSHFVAFTYRTTTGLFVQGRQAPIIAAILNVILSLILGRQFGLAGIFFSTSIARFFSTGIIDPYLVYKYTFGKNAIPYFVNYFKYIILYAFIFVILKYTIGFITISNIFILILAAIMMTIIFNLIMVIAFHRSIYFKELKGTLMRMVQGKLKKS